MEVILDKDYTHKLLGCAYEVHSALGPGLLESVYEAALCYELQSQGFEIRHQVPVKVQYKNVGIDMDLRLDIFCRQQRHSGTEISIRDSAGTCKTAAYLYAADRCQTRVCH